jgi:hypothetical protein
MILKATQKYEKKCANCEKMMDVRYNAIIGTQLA